MQNPVKERTAKLREEIAQLTEADRLYSQGGKKLHGATGITNVAEESTPTLVARIAEALEE
jgi:hypothetical protein